MQHNSQKGRRYRARKKIKAARAAGLASDLPPLQAIRLGICPLCSARCAALHLHISVHFLGLLRAEARLAFLRKLGLPDDTSLMTDALRTSERRAHLKLYAGPDGDALRANLAAKARGNPNHYRADVPNWPIMRLIARGATAEQTWKALGLGEMLKPHAVGKRGRALGFRYGAEGLCDQCEPYSYGRLHQLRSASGFEATEFEQNAGLGEGRTNLPAKTIVNPRKARLAIKWRDEVLRALLHTQSLRVAGKEFRKDDVLLALLPEMVETNRALEASIGEIRQEARNHLDWGVEELFEKICKMAAREQNIENNTDHTRRKTLRYLCEEASEAWLSANLARLRGTDDDGPLVRDLLGHRYRVTEKTVQNALKAGTGTVQPANMRALIRKYVPDSAAEPPK